MNGLCSWVHVALRGQRIYCSGATKLLGLMWCGSLFSFPNISIEAKRRLGQGQMQANIRGFLAEHLSVRNGEIQK